jgi:cytochrome c oxidase subunit 3
MQIPHEVQARPDTGLYNAKVGIWLFLASEVMLFGGLFSAYIFLRLAADDGYWPQGLLNVPIGTFNTAILILSSVTVIRAWVALKMRRYSEYKKWMLITILCGSAFLFIKLVFEWPPKFNHFGAILRKDKWAKYEDYLDNKGLKERGRPPRVEISGHLHGIEVSGDKSVLDQFAGAHHLEIKPLEHHAKADEHAKPAEEHGEPVYELVAPQGGHAPSPRVAEKVAKLKGVKIVAFDVQLDEHNANPTSKHYDRSNFKPLALADPPKNATIAIEDIHHWSAFVPKHSTYFSTYFMITGLHGLHVLAGVLVFCFLWGPGAALYRKNPEHLANRVEVAGLFWHFVDLIWIFVFPLFYLL